MAGCGKAIVVGSGAGGAVMAMELAGAGWDVVILEKGSNYYTGLGSAQGPQRTLFSNDEVKDKLRYFEQPDPIAFPRTFRADASGPATYVGPLNDLPVTVGGGTVHWDAKTPRFWDIDFKGLSMLGPFPGADMADWPFSYGDLAPYYDEVEALIGVAGAVGQMPANTLAHAPHHRDFPMPPGPQQRSSSLIAEGCRTLGLHPYPFPMAINSQPYDGRATCNNCGFCSGYGCPILARVGALAPLQRAMRTGRVDLRTESMAVRVHHSGTRATAVSYLSADGTMHTESADLVVLAASAIETTRLALLSGLPDRSGRLGRRLMFHSFTLGFGIFLHERVHAYRGRSSTVCMEDWADPDYTGARVAAKAAGLPYIRGGLCECGGSQEPVAEGTFYQLILSLLQPQKPFGATFKQLMRTSLLRDRLSGMQMIGTDLPYMTNTVDLDPKVKDMFGVPAPRITYSLGNHENVASLFYIPIMTAVLKAAGADLSAAIPGSTQSFTPGSSMPDTKHIMGGMQMGTSPSNSVTDPYGRIHGFDNLVVADGSVFVTSGAQHPTNTLMAGALRSARNLVGASAASCAAPTGAPNQPPIPAGAPDTGGGGAA
ncbi:MAG: GMC oxidoreductase, partial [Acidimicrobiales bacterium]